MTKKKSKQPEQGAGLMRANVNIDVRNNAEKIASWPVRRTLAKLSLDKMAEITGISKSQLSLYENGHTKPGYEAIDKIEAVLRDHFV